MNPRTRIKILPEEKEIFISVGSSLIEASLEAGIPINTPCGGKGTCGKCKVRITPPPPPTPQEKKILSSSQIKKGWRLACQHQVTETVTVEIPPSSRFYQQVILTRLKEGRFHLSPPLKKITLDIPSPSLKDQRDLLTRLKESSPLDLKIDLSTLRTLPSSLPRPGKVRVLVNEKEILTIGEVPSPLMGIAIDLGTTTIVGYLVNMETGEVKDVHSLTNPQITYGDDVISRIQYAITQKNGLEELQKVVLNALNQLIEELCLRNNIPKEGIFEITIAGNSAMYHLLLGVDPSLLSYSPYISVWREALYLSAKEVGIEINPRGRVYLLPNIACFVGGDTSALILSTGIHTQKGVRVALDLGTNGEIVLSIDGKLTVTSTAMGPAFEGARLSQGMRAELGAIQRVKINQDVEINVIGGVKPRGICGSGAVDTVAELLKWGIIEENGRLRSREELKGKVPPKILKRLEKGKFILFKDEEEVALTQRDIREIQLAKGAVRAGLRVLLKLKGLQEEDIDELLVAGGFGNYISKRSAQKIGLLPSIEKEKIKMIGNAAGAGARMALICTRCRKKISRLVEKVEFLELGGKKEFQEEFTSQLSFKESHHFLGY